MNIIQTSPTSNGSRPPIQSWEEETPPEGYAICPEVFHPLFAEAKGFVSIEVESGVVMSMAENREAKTAWEQTPEPPKEPTIQEAVLSMLVDLEMRLSMQEAGVKI